MGLSVRGFTQVVCCCAEQALHQQLFQPCPATRASRPRRSWQRPPAKTAQSLTGFACVATTPFATTQSADTGAALSWASKLLCSAGAQEAQWLFERDPSWSTEKHLSRVRCCFLAQI